MARRPNSHTEGYGSNEGENVPRGHMRLPRRVCLLGQGLPPHLRLAESSPSVSAFFPCPRSTRGRILTGMPCPGEKLAWSLPEKLPRVLFISLLGQVTGMTEEAAFPQGHPLFKIRLPILSSQEVSASPPHTAADSLLSNLITAETRQGRETWTGVIAVQIDCISHPAFL